MTVNKCLDLSVKYSVDLPYFEKKKLYHSITLRLYVLFVSRLEYWTSQEKRDYRRCPHHGNKKLLSKFHKWKREQNISYLNNRLDILLVLRLTRRSLQKTEQVSSEYSSKYRLSFEFAYAEKLNIRLKTRKVL